MAVHALYQISGAANTAAQTSAGNWIPLDKNITPFNVGFGVRTGGTLTYWVEHTFAEYLTGVDQRTGVSASAVVFRHSDVSAQSSAKDGNYAFPIAAIRLVVGTIAVSGTAILEVIQAGP